MPVSTGKDSKGCYAQWGSQKKYYYECGNKSARERAKAKAERQGQAAHASGYKMQDVYKAILDACFAIKQEKG